MSGDWVSWVRTVESAPYYPVLLTLIMQTAWQWGMCTNKRGMFFGVRVDDEFAQSLMGQQIARQFRMVSWLWMLLALAIYLSTSPWRNAPGPAGMVQAILWLPSGLMLGNSVVYAISNRRVKQSAVTMIAPTTRMASLFVEDEAASLWMDVVDWLAIGLPVGLPLMTAVIVLLRWHHYPAAYNVKFEMETTLFALCGGVFPSGLYFALRYRARSSDWASDPRASRRYRMLLGLPFSVMFSVGMVQMCGLTIIPLFGQRRSEMMSSFMQLMLFTTFAMLAFVFAAFAYLRKAMQRGASDPMSDECWKWGSMYYNPADPALVVPGRQGFGLSPNYASRALWVWGAIYTVGVSTCLVSLLVKLASKRLE